MSEQMTKAKLIEQIRDERTQLEAALTGLSEQQMTQPGAQNDWSVKDIMAHIVWWESRMRAWIPDIVRGQKPEMPAPGMTWDEIDRLNLRTYQENRDRPLNEVIADFHRSYEQSLALVEGMDEQRLLSAEGLRHPLWEMVAANTSNHYREHREPLQQWLSAA